MTSATLPVPPVPGRPQGNEFETLSAALDLVDICVFLQDPDGRITYANRAFCERFGLKPDQIIGRTDADLVGPDSASALSTPGRLPVDRGIGRAQEELTSSSLTGAIRSWSTVRYPVRDSQGQVTGLVGIATDVTDLQRDQANASASAARFRLLFEQSPLGIFLMDTDSRIVDCNAKFVEYAGAPRERIVGFRMLSDALDTVLCEPIRRALDGHANCIDTEYRSTTGNRRSFYRYHFQPLYDDGTMSGLLAFAEDISATRAAEKKASDREALIERIFDTATVAIFLVDRQGVITQANRRMAEMFDQPLDGLIGNEYLALIHPDQRAAASLRLAMLLAGEIDSTDVERLYQRPDGSSFWGRITASRLADADGEQLGLVTVLADIDRQKQADLALRMAQQQFRDLVDSTAGIVWEADAASFAFTFVSLEAERLLGYPVADWYQPGFWVAHLHPEDAGWAPGFCASCTGRLEAHDFEYRFIARDGRTVWLRDIVKVVAENGVPRWLRGVMVDITASKNANERHSRIIESSMDGFLVINLRGEITEFNASLAALTGYPPEELRRLDVRRLDAVETAEETKAHIAEITRKGRDRFETRWLRKDGSLADVEITASYLELRQEICAFVRDISVIKAHQRELDHIAHYDALTGVPNRTLLADRMAQAVAQTRRSGKLLAVCYLDLDGFKPINDTFGHETGDRVLVEVAARLEAAMRGGDTAARIGGDEFVLLLLGIERADECDAALQRILDAVSRPLRIAEHTLLLSASLGVALYPRDDVDTDTLLRHADQAMYIAKQLGRNRYHLFDAENDRVARERGERLARIGQAIARREFVLYYQPQVDMRSGQIDGVEALIRWLHPERGLLPPADFLSAIEDSDAIVELGDWVIATALCQAAEWKRLGKPIRVGVNIAARHLLAADFTTRLRDHLGRHPELEPRWLELEILETAALDDLEQVFSIIQECRALGVRFALDDFGTGYSSLGYLKALPAETIKIDQTFVRDMLFDVEDRAIVEGVIGLARIFHRDVIAEGVETIEHGTLLLQLGCVRAQGYGIARPIPAAEISGWIERFHPDPAWRIAAHVAP